MSTDVGTDIGLLLDAVDQFADKAGQRLFAHESPDGDLGAVGDLLADAAAMGLLADVDVEAGRWGVWGAHVDDDGPALSLAALRRLGRVCAGLAAAVHAQGIGVLLLGPGDDRGRLDPGARLGAAFCPSYGLAIDPRTTRDGMRLVDGGLVGTARFVLAAGNPDALVLAVHLPDERGSGRAVVVVPVDTPRLRLVATGRRIGLRAVTVLDVVADGVTVSGTDLRLHGGAADDRLLRTVAADWLGQAAIALGCAEEAVSVARDYTRSRFQGGGPISEHAAIRLLLGRAEHDAAVVASVLDRHATTPLSRLSPEALLRWAVDARVAAAEHASRAVTDALQTLGGYGYMDEYGLSKRLRDVTALRVLHGAPDQLLMARPGGGA